MEEEDQSQGRMRRQTPEQVGALVPMDEMASEQQNREMMMRIQSTDQNHI